jgi:hypothetical protein
MSRRLLWWAAVALLVLVAGGAVVVHANHRETTFVLTMTNDPTSNAIKVYDARTHALIQTLSTRGKGGVGGNARGVKQYQGELFAAVNFGSNSVAVFRRVGGRLAFDTLVTTSSAPVSIDFGNDHMYVAGATTIDSFVMRRNHVEWMDGTTTLRLVDGGPPPDGSTAQVGIINARQALVTLKTDPDPGTVDVVSLDDGAVMEVAPEAVSAPPGTLTPFGFSVYGDGTAVITLAHSNQDGLFRDGAFTAVIAAGQAAPCWTTRVGKYVFTANTGSRTIGRLVGTGSNIFVDAAVAAMITTGGAPSDIDAEDGVLAVLDRGAGQSHVSLFAYDRFGELTPNGSQITIDVATANGVAIMPPSDRDDR